MLNNYEAMFLFDPAAATDWEAVRKEVDRLMERARAQVIACARWDECRLAYEIRGRRRGLYVLTYFKAEPDAIRGLERDAVLSEMILRLLVLRVEHMTEQQMKEAASERRHAPHAEGGEGEDQRHGHRHGHGHGRRGPASEAAAAPAGTQGSRRGAGPEDDLSAEE